MGAPFSLQIGAEPVGDVYNFDAFVVNFFKFGE